MSADTIPADVQVLAKIETFEKDYAGSIYIGGAHLNRHLWPLLQEVRAILTDRSTRPAEPAAPVAEAGDGETYYTKGKDADWFEGLSHQDAAWALTCAAMDLNDTGLGDHVDLFMPHNAMLSGAGDRIKNLCSALEAERARADAAEQRAADALARAEKAEGALETAREDTARLDYLDRCNQALNAHYGTTYRWELVQSHNVNRLMLGHMVVDLNDSAAKGLPSCRDAIDRARRRAALARSDARASREAQPATDGGDNG